MKVGDKIYIQYGRDFHKAVVISERDGQFMFELTGWASGLTGIISNEKWFPRETLLSKLLKRIGV